MSSSGVPLTVWLLSAIFVGTGLIVFALVSRRVFNSGGKVETRQLGGADLLAASLLTLWFFSIVGRGFTVSGARAIENSDIVESAVLISMIVVAIGSFLHFRKIRVWQLLGLHQLKFTRAAALALGLFFAAYPLLGAANWLMESQLGSDAKRQEIVNYFSEAAQQSQMRSLIITIALGVLFAPIAEEFIFRGYLYGVFKKYIGIFGGTLINSALFALFHLNLTSIPALMLLAVCLTLAYEFTGSIAVPMLMHAMLNSMTFAILLHDAQLPR